MTSVIRIKKGGVWVGPIADGTLRVKKDDAWVGAAIPYVNRGNAWVDTGYRGAPLAPQNLAINGWDFSNINVRWDAPAAGGGPVASYDVKMTDNGGVNVIETKTGLTSSPSPNFAIAQDNQVAFFVRAVGPTGLTSAWAQGNAIGDGRMWSRATIGHTETGYYANENRTRAWTSSVESGARNGGANFEFVVPTSVNLKTMTWNNLRTPQSSVVSGSGYPSRYVVMILNDANGGALHNFTGQINSGDSRTFTFGLGGPQGTGGHWGLSPVGSGWSTSGNSYYQLHVDSLYGSGIETYQVSVYYQTRAYKGNDYW